MRNGPRESGTQGPGAFGLKGDEGLQDRPWSLSSGGVPLRPRSGSLTETPAALGPQGKQVRVSSSSTSVPCSPPPSENNLEAKFLGNRPAATTSSSSPGSAGRRAALEGQDLLLQSPAANRRLFPGCGEGPSRVGQQGGTG